MTASATRFRLKGDLLTDGRINKPGARSMTIDVIDGRAHLQNELETLPLCINVDGEIGAQGCEPGYGFLPDNGEVERVERASGAQIFVRV